MIRDGEKIDMLYKESLNNLYKELQGHNIEDILIEEPSIEEVFMHYYEKEQGEKEWQLFLEMSGNQA